MQKFSNHFILTKLRITLLFTTIIFTCALVIYSAYLNSFWMDELAVWYYSNNNSFGRIFEEWSTQTNPPVYFVFMKAYMKFVTPTELNLRLPSLIAFFASLGIIHRIGTHLAVSKKSWMPTLLVVMFSFSECYLRFAIEARAYSLLTCGLLLYFYSILKLENSEKFYWRTTLVGVLSFVCAGLHYFGALFVLTYMGLTVLTGSKKVKVKTLISHTPLLLVGLVFLTRILSLASAKFPFWIPEVSVSLIVTEALYSLNERSITAALVKVSPLIIGLLYSLRNLLKRTKLTHSQICIINITIAYVVMIAATAAKSMIGTSIFHYKYLAIYSPFVIIASAISLQMLLPRRMRDRAICAFTLVYMFAYFAFSNNPCTIKGTPCRVSDSTYPISASPLWTITPRQEIKEAVQYSTAIKKDKYPDAELIVVAYNPNFTDLYYNKFSGTPVTKIHTYHYLHEDPVVFHEPFADQSRVKIVMIYEPEFQAKFESLLKRRIIESKEFIWFKVYAVR